jgi:hypothetical protein
LDEYENQAFYRANESGLMAGQWAAAYFVPGFSCEPSSVALRAGTTIATTRRR